MYCSAPSTFRSNNNDTKKSNALLRPYFTQHVLYKYFYAHCPVLNSIVSVGHVILCNYI